MDLRNSQSLFLTLYHSGLAAIPGSSPAFPDSRVTQHLSVINLEYKQFLATTNISLERHGWFAVFLFVIVYYIYINADIYLGFHGSFIPLSPTLTLFYFYRCVSDSIKPLSLYFHKNFNLPLSVLTFVMRVHKVQCNVLQVIWSYTHSHPPLPRGFTHTPTHTHSGSGADAPLTAFQRLIPALWHTQCPLAARSNPKGLASIFSNGFTGVRWSLDGWRLFGGSWRCGGQLLLSSVWNMNVCVYVFLNNGVSCLKKWN